MKKNHIDNICPIQPKYFNRLNELYNSVFNRKRSLNHYNWEFRNGPYGHAYQLLAIDSNNQVIAHWGLLPNYIRVGNLCFRAGKTENTMINPKYRGKGLYKNFEKQCLAKAWSEGYEIPWVTLSAAANVHEKVGYSVVGPITTLIRPTTANILQIFARFFRLIFTNSFRYKTVRSLVGNLLEAIKANRKYFKVKNSVKFKLSAYNKKQVDGFLESWKEQRNFGGKDFLYTITLERTYEYLKWRFIDNPYVNYNWKILINQYESICGYIIYHKVLATIYVDDLMLLDEYLTADSIQSVFLSLCCDKEFKKCLIVDFLSLQGSAIFDLLLDAGFRCRSDTKNSYELTKCLMVSPNPGLSPEILKLVLKPDKWYLSRIYTEGLN